MDRGSRAGTIIQPFIWKCGAPTKARPECQSVKLPHQLAQLATRMRRNWQHVRTVCFHPNQRKYSLKTFCCAVTNLYGANSADQRLEVQNVYHYFFPVYRLDTRCSLKCPRRDVLPQDGSWPPRASPLAECLFEMQAETH